MSAHGPAIRYSNAFVKPKPSSPAVAGPRRVLVAAAIVFGALTYFTARAWSPLTAPLPKNNALPSPVTAGSAADEAATESAIRFYSERIKRDPEDTRSQNALAELYLQRVRESGNEDYLPMAIQAARASLAAVVPERNFGGLTALAHAEFANHGFAEARDHATQLTQLDPTKSESYAILGDALLELGDYEGAAKAFDQMRSLGENDTGKETRLARFAFLRGATDEARRHFGAALDLLLASENPPRETVAWCRWQLGETAFATGDYATAERHYREALSSAPDYFRALGSMGRLSAARGNLPLAINYYEQAARIVPVADFMAALGDLYRLSDRSKDALVRYELVEQLGEHSRKVHGTPYDRRIALFFADHGIKTDEAYTLARGEFDAGRHDIYGADAVAWTAFKRGNIPEAQVAMNEALRLGTQDARLFYHAGMIARAASDKKTAGEFLRRALSLNPHFDPLQSESARKALQELQIP